MAWLFARSTMLVVGDTWLVDRYFESDTLLRFYNFFYNFLATGSLKKTFDRILLLVSHWAFQASLDFVDCILKVFSVFFFSERYFLKFWIYAAFPPKKWKNGQIQNIVMWTIYCNIIVATLNTFAMPLTTLHTIQ